MNAFCEKLMLIGRRWIRFKKHMGSIVSLGSGRIYCTYLNFQAICTLKLLTGYFQAILFRVDQGHHKNRNRNSHDKEYINNIVHWGQWGVYIGLITMSVRFEWDYCPLPSECELKYSDTQESLVITFKLTLLTRKVKKQLRSAPERLELSIFR